MDLKEQNILFLSRSTQHGGTENVILQLCEIFRMKVKKVVVCTAKGFDVSKIADWGIKYYEIPDIENKSPLVMLRTAILIRNIIQKENITVIHSHHRMAAFYTELIAPQNVIKLANAHNTFENKKNLTRFAYRNTQIIAVGECVKQNLMEYFEISERQITVIHNAVKEFDGIVQTIDVLKQERDLGHILIGNIGRITEQKGMSYFIEAAEITAKFHPEARFVIVGDGEEKTRLEKLIEEKGLKERIIFLGYRSDIQNVMCQLDFIVLSSLWEGLPLTPIESFSVGKTVIGTAVDGTTEIIRDGVDGYLIEPKSPEQIADKMNYLIEHTDVRKEMEKQAKQRYLDEFSLEKLFQKYIRFYTNM